jgi:hypothetical protein
MVRTCILAMVVLGVAMGPAVVASGQDFTPAWVGEIKGSPDVFGVAAYYHAAPRVHVGFEVAYWDGLREGQRQAVSFEAVAKYFALERKPVNLGLLKQQD